MTELESVNSRKWIYGKWIGWRHDNGLTRVVYEKVFDVIDVLVSFHLG